MLYSEELQRLLEPPITKVISRSEELKNRRDRDENEQD